MAVTTARRKSRRTATSLVGRALLAAVPALGAVPRVAAAQGVPRLPSQPPPRRGNGRPVDPLNEARQRFERGVDLTDAGFAGAALVEFRRAYELTHNPVVLFNIAITLEATGEYVAALEAMRAYRVQAPADVVDRHRVAIAEIITRLQSRVGIVTVAVDAPDLVVRVDNVVRPLPQVRAGVVVPTGRHTVSLAAPEYHPREIEFDVVGGQTVRIDQPLAPVQWELSVESNVAGAEVMIDGSNVGTTPLASPVRVSQGIHHVEAHRPGYTTYASDVRVTCSGTRVTVQMAWADPIPAAVAARLVLRANEPGIRATLDGHNIPVDGDEAVPPGAHTLRVEHPDRITLEREIVLPPGRPSVADVALVPTPSARALRVDGARNTGWALVGSGLALLVGGGVWLGVNEFQLAGTTSQITPAVPAGDPLRVDAATRQQLRYPSAIIAGVGLVEALAGIAVVLAAPSFDRSPRTPAVRLQAGLTSVSLGLTF